MLVSLKSPSWGFGLVCCALLVYLRPEPPGTGRERLNKVAFSDALPSQGEPDARAGSRSEI